MTLQERVAAFIARYPKWPASWPHIVREGDHEVVYAIWCLGKDYRNKTWYYGAYPPGYVDRVTAMFPDVRDARKLHVFSGSLEASSITTLDINPATRPSIVGDVCNVADIFKGEPKFRLILADPPYSSDDAKRYGTPMVNRRRAMAALAQVTAPRGHLVWLDTVWPMYRNADWRTVGRIAIVRSTNHRIRMTTIFERRAA